MQSKINKKFLKERAQKVKQLRLACKNDLYPILVESGQDIESIKSLLEILGVVVQQAFMNLRKETTIGDLKIQSYVDKKAPDANTHIKALNVLNDYSVADAMEMISGFPTAIDNIIKGENKQRKFSELEIDWDKV